MPRLVRALTLGLMIVMCGTVGPRFQVVATALEALMPPTTTLSDWHGDFYDRTAFGYFTIITRATANQGDYRAFGVDVRDNGQGLLVGRVAFNIYLPNDATVAAFRIRLSKNLADIAAATGLSVASGIVDLTRPPVPCCDGGDGDNRLAAQLSNFAVGAIAASADLENSWTGEPR